MGMVVTLSLSGCATEVLGSADPNAADLAALKEPVNGASVFGDYSTVDYCGFLQAETVTSAGAENPSPPRRSFSSCSLRTQLSGRTATVEVGYVDLPTTGSHANRVRDDSVTLAHGMSIERQEETDAGCVHYLVFADGVSLSANVFGDQIPTDSLCSLSKAVAVGASITAVEHPAAHVTFAPNSLGRLDTCDLFSVEQTAALLERPAVTKTIFPAKHECRWGQEQSVYVSAFVTIDSPVVAGPDAHEETLAGRVSMVQPTTQFCTISTVQGPATGASNGDKEIAAVNALVGDTGKDACSVAREVANAVWPKLPPQSQ
jgi:hypothetical protein